jgi:hypothetical protein
MFALDVFDSGLSGMQQIKALAMHLIPSFVLILMLVFAWRYELHGGVAFIMLGAGFTPFIFMGNYNMNHSLGTSLVIIITTTIPFMVVGMLFILSYFLKKRNKEKGSA